MARAVQVVIQLVHQRHAAGNVELGYFGIGQVAMFSTSARLLRRGYRF